MALREYHYFISGLPDLSFNEPGEWITPGSFKKILKEQLHPDDYRQAELVFLKEDHSHLISFLENGEMTAEGNGNYSADDYRNQISLFSSILPAADILPAYMVNVLRDHGPEDKEKDSLQIARMLTDGYYLHVMENGIPFLRKYTAFDYDLNNLLAFVKAGDHGLVQERFIAGDSGFSGHLRRYAGKSLPKDPGFELFDEIMSYTGSQSFAEEEIKFDRLRWRMIEELILFEDFSIEKILGYLLQMLILKRWSSLNKESGKAKLREILDRSTKEAFKGFE